MSKYKIYEKPDGSVAMLVPAPKNRAFNETEDQHLARAAAQHEMRKPEFKQYASTDVDAADLPTRIQTDVQGDVFSTRDGWVLNGGKLEMDASKYPPRPSQVWSTISKNTTAQERMTLQPHIGLFISSLNQKDWPMIQMIYNQWKVNLSIPSTVRELIATTLTVKGCPTKV